MRTARAVVCGLVVVGAIVVASPAASASSPYPVNMRVNLHKVVEVYPNWLNDAPASAWSVS